MVLTICVMPNDSSSYEYSLDILVAASPWSHFHVFFFSAALTDFGSLTHSTHNAHTHSSFSLYLSLSLSLFFFLSLSLSLSTTFFFSSEIYLLIVEHPILVFLIGNHFIYIDDDFLH